MIWVLKTQDRGSDRVVVSASGDLEHVQGQMVAQAGEFIQYAGYALTQFSTSVMSVTKDDKGTSFWIEEDGDG